MKRVIPPPVTEAHVRACYRRYRAAVRAMLGDLADVYLDRREDEPLRVDHDPSDTRPWLASIGVSEFGLVASARSKAGALKKLVALMQKRVRPALVLATHA